MLDEFISVKGIKALGNQLTTEKVKNINVLDPLPYEEPGKQEPKDMEVVDEEDVNAESAHEPKVKKDAPADNNKPPDPKKKPAGGEGQGSLFD